MSIEHDIQSKFRGEHHKIMVNLIYTYNWAMEKSKRFFEKADLTPQQFNILRILRGAAKPLSTLQIRQRMLDRMSDTSRIVDRLLKKELVQKGVCKGDRRLVDITISDKGSQLLLELDNYNEEMDAVLSAINEEEAKTLNHLLDKLRGSA
ncbi:MAG: MarR family transcriptional regulator [Chitinophagaceae bacterium]|nr:MarR family transcriptional regulator [Chitinophagaceae bacterium]